MRTFVVCRNPACSELFHDATNVGTGILKGLIKAESESDITLQMALEAIEDSPVSDQLDMLAITRLQQHYADSPEQYVEDGDEVEESVDDVVIEGIGYVLWALGDLLKAKAKLYKAQAKATINQNGLK